MKRFSLPPVLCLLSLVLALALDSFGESRPALATAFGLRITVNTRAYQFERPSPEVPITSRSPKTSFIATATITNGSRAAIPFNIPREITGPQRIVFKIHDSEGHEVWRSEPEVPGGADPQYLRPGATWRRTMQIPLVTQSGPLPAGRYSLEAALVNGDPVTASTLFEVTPNNQPPVEPTTISGFVLDTYYMPIGGVSTAIHAPVNGAHVIVEEAHGRVFQIDPPLFRWDGITDANGRFSLVARPGTFVVKAIRSFGPPIQFQSMGSISLNPPIFIGPNPPITVPAFQDGSVKITVSPGETSHPVVMAGTAANEKLLITGLGGVTIRPVPGEPNIVVVSAAGVVSTGGWSQPDLVSQELLPNGTLLLDFVARSPGPNDVVTQAFEGVTASMRIPRLPGMKSVRVRSDSNTVTAPMPK
jgi:hypothetical protein